MPQSGLSCGSAYGTDGLQMGRLRTPVIKSSAFVELGEKIYVSSDTYGLISKPSRIIMPVS